MSGNERTGFAHIEFGRAARAVIGRAAVAQYNPGNLSGSSPGPGPTPGSPTATITSTSTSTAVPTSTPTSTITGITPTPVIPTAPITPFTPATPRISPRRPSRLNLLLQQINDRLPITLQGRWRLDRRSGTALAAAVALVAVVLGGWTLFRAQSQQVGQPRLLTAGHPAHPFPQAGPPGQDAYHDPNQGHDQQADAGGTSPVSAFEGAPSATGLVIDVEGKVAKPGVFHLPTGSRVMDALRAAGGALPGTDLIPLNQARVLNDGEQLLVGAPPGLDTGTGINGGSGANGAGAQPPTSGHSGGRGKVPPSGPIHLNTATADQLEQLPGVGPALAQRIMDWRTQHGGFASIGQLQQVHGLGPAKFSALRQWVTP